MWQVRREDAIAALRERLAQPEQEPAIYPDEAYEMGLERIAYYTAPPRREWVGLTDEDMVMCESEEDVRFVRAIEAKLKEKNT